MTWLTDTVAGRTLLMLVIGIGGVMALSHALYEIGLDREHRARHASRLADRLLLLEQSVMRLPPEERDAAAHALSGGAIEVHWSKRQLAAPGGPADTPAHDLRQRLLASAPELGARSLILGSNREPEGSHPDLRDADADHAVLISMALADGSWINVSIVTLEGAKLTSPSAILSFLVLLAGAVLVSVLMARWLTQPLSALTGAANRLYAGAETPSFPEAGPREIRELSLAFNAMRGRIARLIGERTQTLAAISHDLRTPLTRLRLRVEDLGEETIKSSIARDLDEMEEMVDSALDFLKGDATEEAIHALDLVAILESITSDMTDADADVSLAGQRHVVIHGRRLALKRAFTNLIQNAVKYGHAARVSIAASDDAIEVAIEDDGPGLPPAELEAVFSPFYRVEASRGRETGGHGLGLTVARAIVRAHGGEVTLSNRQPNGLRALAILPRAA